MHGQDGVLGFGLAPVVITAPFSWYKSWAVLQPHTTLSLPCLPVGLRWKEKQRLDI